MSGGVRMPSLPPVDNTPAAPTAAELAAQKAAADKEAQMLRNRRGRSSTILTGPLGLMEEPPVGKKTLLGA